MGIAQLQQDMNLTNCEREPVHIPGSIQSHGVLLVLREADLTLLQVSENVRAVFGVSPQSVLNRHISSLLEPDQIALLEAALQVDDIQIMNPMKLRAKVAKHEIHFDGILHRSDGLLLLELEMADEQESTSFVELYMHIKASLTRLQHASNLQQLCQVAAEEVRRITGFDRVMIYRFDEQWNGVVVAEDKKAGLDTFFGLHFPASDIPAPARELYLKNWLRLISDVGYQPAAIIPAINPDTQLPVNLSFSVLRSVSPTHIEYLKNMGVRASMSVSLLKGDTLWGLIACHHLTPKYVRHEIRSTCELLGQVVSTQLPARQDHEAYQYEMQVKDIQTRLVSALVQEDDVMKGLKGHGAELLKLVSAQGLAICFEKGYDIVGKVPAKTELLPLIQWLRNTMSEDVFQSSNLPGVYPEAVPFKDTCSGLLAMFISRLQGVLLIWFRPEVIQTVNWGGNPDEGIKQGEQVTDLHPRKSFDLWKQTIGLTSLPWQPCEIQAVTELRGAIVDKVLQDVVLKQTLTSWLKQ